jgi:pSer/pThr/pTyr-binding forkhead associated (FHA) protein
VLADDTVSRHHAELIFLHNGHLLLIDCHSQNKTSIVENGQVCRISQADSTAQWLQLMEKLLLSRAPKNQDNHTAIGIRAI